MIASAATLLGVAALGIEYRETRDEAIRIRLDAMADAAVAETLAHRHLLRVARRPFADGWIESQVERPAPGRALVRAHAGLGQRVRSVEVEVAITATGPRVLGWRPLPPPAGLALTASGS